MAIEIKHIYKKKFKSNFSFFALCIFTGSVFESENEKGLAHLIEHLLFKGNKYIKTSKNLNNKLNGMGVTINAFTNNFFTVYYLITPNKYITTVINILFQIVFSTKINKKSFEDEKKIVINELIEKINSPGIFIFLN